MAGFSTYPSSMEDSSAVSEIESTKTVVLIVQNGKQAVHNGATPTVDICQPLRRHFTCSSASSLKQAREVIRSGAPIAGAILDIDLPDGSGFDLVDELRSLNPSLPLLFVTAVHDPWTLSRAHLAKVPLVTRRSCVQNVKFFASDVQTSLACASDNLEDALAQITYEKRLSTRESQLLRVAAHGIPRAHLARRLGASENTVKSRIRSLLGKTKKSSLSEVVWLVHSPTNRA